MNRPWLSVIGLGPEGEAGLTAGALAALGEAAHVVCAERHAGLLPEALLALREPGATLAHHPIVPFGAREATAEGGSEPKDPLKAAVAAKGGKEEEGASSVLRAATAVAEADASDVVSPR